MIALQIRKRKWDGEAINEMNEGSNALLLLRQQVEQCASEMSPCYGQILRAQMEILGLVQRPVLLNYVASQVLHNVEESLTYASSLQEVEQIQQYTETTIQNLLFYTRAILFWNIKKNRSEALELLSDAANAVANGISALIEAEAGSIKT